MAISIQVLAFAGARDVIGEGELTLVLEEALPQAAQVMDVLCERYPGLAPHRPHIRLAVNGEYAGEDAEVKDGDEVALIPPVAGG